MTLLNVPTGKSATKPMPKLDRDGVKIYYEVHGSGTPLLLTHGFSSTSAMWQGQIEELSKHHNSYYGTCAATASPIIPPTPPPTAKRSR